MFTTSTDLQAEPYNNFQQTEGGVWYQLRSEREEICEALLNGAQAPEQRGAILAETDRSNQTADANQLTERLRLIDNALDRLMAGTYGDCVLCGKWIEDTRLDADLALHFCIGCQRKSEGEGGFQSLVFHPENH